MECVNLRDPHKLVEYCRKDGVLAKNQVFKCFNNEFYDHFIKFFFKNCTYNSSLYFVDEQLRTAFDFGVTIFYNTIREKGWVESGASVRCALFAYCFNQLRSLTKYLWRNSGKLSSFDLFDIIKAKKNLFPINPSIDKEEVDEADLKFKAFVDAFEKLKPKCKDFIRWRKLDEITDAEIMTKYPEVNFESRKPTLITHKCMKILKNNI